MWWHASGGAKTSDWARFMQGTRKRKTKRKAPTMHQGSSSGEEPQTPTRWTIEVGRMRNVGAIGKSCGRGGRAGVCACMRVCVCACVFFVFSSLSLSVRGGGAGGGREVARRSGARPCRERCTNDPNTSLGKTEPTRYEFERPPQRELSLRCSAAAANPAGRGRGGARERERPLCPRQRNAPCMICSGCEGWATRVPRWGRHETAPPKSRPSRPRGPLT